MIQPPNAPVYEEAAALEFPPDLADVPRGMIDAEVSHEFADAEVHRTIAVPEYVAHGRAFIHLLEERWQGS